jgi:uncharacterized alkaline shock family protein YloU
MTEETLGKIEISPKVVATIAGHAVLNSYGVVGMASKNIANELAHVLQGDFQRGIDVHTEGDEIIIDVYVIIEYGTRISSVAHSIMNVVKYNVERALGVPVARVNVHVQGLRVSSPD